MISNNKYTDKFGWGVFHCLNIINIVPINDWIQHVHNEHCLCQPTVNYEDGTKFIIHDAVDGRE